MVGNFIDLFCNKIEIDDYLPSIPNPRLGLNRGVSQLGLHSRQCNCQFFTDFSNKAKYEEFRNCLFGRTEIPLDGSNIKIKLVIPVRLNQG